MKKFLFVLISILIIPSVSHGKVLELYFQPQTGYMGSLYNQKKLPWSDTEYLLNTDADYFKVNAGPFAGFTAGLEFMLIDVAIEVNQFVTSEKRSTYFALKVGLDADFELGESSVGTIYLMAGVGLGTIDDAWYDKAQVAHEDLYAQILFVDAGFRYEYKFTEVIRLSIDAGLGMHMMQLAQFAANDELAQSSGVHFYVKGGIRLVFDIFGAKKEEKKSTSEDALPPKQPVTTVSTDTNPSTSSNPMGTNKPAK